MRGWALVLLTAAGCAKEERPPGCNPLTGSVPDVVGFFPGTTRRYVVDRIVLPVSFNEFAVDVDGDERVNNWLGGFFGALAGHAGPMPLDDMVAAGRIASVVEILGEDGARPPIGVRWRWRPDDDGVLLGARRDGGRLRTNALRTTRRPVAAMVELPITPFADPVVLPAHAIDMVLDPDGGGGWNGEMHGVAFPEDCFPLVFDALVGVVLAEPVAHPLLTALLDPEDTGTFSLDSSSEYLFQIFFQPDAHVLGGDGRWSPGKGCDATPESFSLGFGFHLRPCEEGRCADEVAPSCFDRIHNGAETDLDCGGATCRPCLAGQVCRTGTDCDSRHCQGGTCAAPSCADGLRDGLETDVDCGRVCPRRCAEGRRCLTSGDCESGKCFGWFGPGTCVANPR